MIHRLGARIGGLLASLCAASVVVFGFMTVLPGDPARVALGLNADEQAVAELRRTYGTDRPLVVQYLDWMGDLLRGDFGRSYLSGADLGPLIADRFAVTLWLVGTSMVLALVIAVVLGTLMAVRHRHVDGALLSGLSQMGIAVPAFLTGILAVGLFSVRLGWLPAGGWTVPAQDPIGFLARLVLPATALGLAQAAVLARYVRTAVLDVMRTDHLRTARAIGLTRGRALIRHGLRNAAVPVVTVLGLQLATLLVGAIVIEHVFAIPGLGSLLLDAVADRDLLLVQNIVMLLVAAVLLMNTLVDLGYPMIDPRLRRAAE